MTLHELYSIALVGANHTFHFLGVWKATSTIDLVIANFSKGLNVFEISISPYFITFLE